MSVLMQHTSIVIRMSKNNIDLQFIKRFPLKDIINSCEKIEKLEIPVDKYCNNLIIQKELITDNKFAKYLSIACKKNYDISNFTELLESIKNHGKKMSDYSVKDIFRTLNNKKLYRKAYYDFLNYYVKENFYIRKTVTDNLNYFYNQTETKFDELTEGQRDLLKFHFLNDYNLIPRHTIKETYEFLVNNKELRDFIDFLYSKKLNVPLTIKQYEQINTNTVDVLYMIKELINKLQNYNIIYQMLLRWIDNDCSIYDLKVLNTKIDVIENSNLEKILYNKTRYINFIYGNKLKKALLDNIYRSREEDIIIYAIRTNKKNFIKLIENNMEDFFSIPSNSILYNEIFYKKYINLNELTLKHLKKLKTMQYNQSSCIDNLIEQHYTFEEIATLFNLDRQYIKLYNELLSLKVDDRLLRIRQFIKKDLLKNITNYSDILALSEKIKIKPLYSWLEQDFNHIENITIEKVIQILIHYNHIEKFIHEIKNSTELSYILRNYEKVMKYDTLDSIKEDIENLDEYWITLKEIMKFSNDFLQANRTNIKEFLLNDGAELAYTYLISRNIEQNKSFKLIIKAQLMGEFKKLKYHSNDLKQEINYELEDYQIKAWTEKNSEIIHKQYTVGEYDDFYHTMILGEQPRRTCLSYKDGIYNNCLLACFDSNKKILYAKINGKIVARAMVRLTKGTYNKEKQNMKEFSFVDVEAISERKKQENLTLFLEKPYISGISNEEARKVKSLFINLLKDKAKQMDAILVLSNYYNEEIDEEFISKEYYMYISKSKSSSQYLDSLSGQATISDEGQYKGNYFLIWKKSIKDENSIYYESIFAA